MEKIYRKKRVEIKFSEDEFLYLQEKKTKPKLAQFIREFILNNLENNFTGADQQPKKIKPKLKEIDNRLLYHINKIGININQIAKHCNTEKQLDNIVLLNLIEVQKQLKDLANVSKDF